MWLMFFMICFAGIGFMFFCILRKQDALLKAMSEEHVQFKMLLRGLETRLTSQAEQLNGNAGEAPAHPIATTDDQPRDNRLMFSGLQMEVPHHALDVPEKASGLPELKF